MLQLSVYSTVYYKLAYLFFKYIIYKFKKYSLYNY